MAFPPVPAEILREILEFAAASSRPSALALTLVNSNVRLWTLPLLYHSVTLRSASVLKRFLNTLYISATQSRRLASTVPLARRVKHLCIMSLGPVQSIYAILSRCTNLQSLACGFNLCSYAQLGFRLPPRVAVRHSANKVTRETHLIGMSCRDGIPFGIVPQDTTHLHIQPLSRPVLLSLTQLHLHVPNLTHLAISLPSRVLSTRIVASSLFSEILELNPDLKVVLIQMTDISDEASMCVELKDCMTDPRVVFRSAGTASIVTQWEQAVVNGLSIWSEAEQVVERKQYPVVPVTPMALNLPNFRFGRRQGGQVF